MRKVKEQDVLYVLNVIEEYLPLDQPLQLISRINLQGRPCIRCEAISRGRSWFCDIYGKHFFYVHLPPLTPTTFDSIRSLISFLKSHIG